MVLPLRLRGLKKIFAGEGGAFKCAETAPYYTGTPKSATDERRSNL